MNLNLKAIVSVSMLVIMLNVSSKVSAQARPYGVPTIYTIGKDGTNTKQLVSVPGMQWHGSPSWSPDGKWIAFDVSPKWRVFNLCHVYVCTTDGKNLKDLGKGGGARWSPDGQTILFHARPENPRKEGTEIWVMNIDGTQRRLLCDGERPRWSPDGKQIVFVRKNPAAIYLLTLKTMTEEIVLNQDYRHVTGADFSPDGKSLVFIGYREKFPIADLGILTKKEKEWSLRIRYEGRIGWQPSWSPDGKQIVFYTVSEKFSRQLQTISPNGKEPPLRLTSHDNDYMNMDASWSPDSKRVIFSRAPVR